MYWVAFDAMVAGVERFGLDGPVDRWRAVRDEIHDDVVEKGYDAERGTFTQAYGSDVLDACALLIPRRVSFERLLTLRNDVGLLGEEYDTRAERLVGNFPQALTHLALVNCAMELSNRGGNRAARE